MKTYIEIIIATAFTLLNLLVSFSQSYYAHHNLNSTEYQQKFDEYTGQGYHIVQVDGYGIGWSITGSNYWHNGSVADSGAILVNAGNGLSYSFLTTDALDGGNGLRIEGQQAGDQLGDINGDGLADFIAGTPDPGQGFIVNGMGICCGDSYVIFGRDGEFNPALNEVTWFRFILPV